MTQQQLAAVQADFDRIGVRHVDRAWILGRIAESEANGDVTDDALIECAFEHVLGEPA